MRAWARSIRRAWRSLIPAATSPRKPSLKPGSVFVMCPTVASKWSVALEARLADMGLLYKGSKLKIINPLLARMHIAAAAEAMPMR